MGNILGLQTSTSFVYEDLITHVQQMQEQLKIAIKLLDNRWKNRKENCEEMKSRSFTFIDPIGNKMNNKYVDHELLSTILRKYRQNYIPKYLQTLIEIGIKNQNSISSLNEEQLKATVSEYRNHTVFSAYVNMDVWIECETTDATEIVLIRVLPSSSWDTIERELKSSLKCNDIELRLFTSDRVIEPNQLKWENGTKLKSQETFLSHKLYEKYYVIMAKRIEDDVSDYIITFLFQSFLYIIFFFFSRIQLQQMLLTFKFW